MRSESKAKKEHNSWDLVSNIGSMRKGKEWRRTLASRLIEERYNVALEGDQGIDLLWETYESRDLSESKRMISTKTNKKNISNKDKNIDYYGQEFEMAADGQQHCCLQASKMNMGRQNLVKISKAFKGIYWLYQVKRHGNVNKDRL